MSKFVLQDQIILIGGYSATGDINAATLEFGAEPKDSTVLGVGTRTNLGGLKTVQAQVNGFYDPESMEAQLWPNVGVSDQLLSISSGSTVGSVGYFFKTVHGNFNWGETIGEVNKFDLGAGASGSLYRGYLEWSSLSTADTASDASAGIQLGAVSSSQSLYAALHVVAAGGTTPTLDIDVESDDNAGFTSASTVMSFTQVTTSVTSELISTAGAITDDYFRINFTLGGTSPSYQFAVFLGVQ